MKTRRRNRIHLIHHLFDALPTDRWFSAWQLCELLYRDRGPVHPQQKRYVEKVLDAYRYTPLIDTDDTAAPCRLYRRVDPYREPRPAGPNAQGTLQDLHRHAVQPMTRDDLALLRQLRDEAGAIGVTHPSRSAYEPCGRPVPVGLAEGDDASPTLTRCPPALAGVTHDPDRRAEPVLYPDNFIGIMRADNRHQWERRHRNAPSARS